MATPHSLLLSQHNGEDGMGSGADGVHVGRCYSSEKVKSGEPLNNGHASWDPAFLSFVERLSSFGVSFIGGFIVSDFEAIGEFHREVYRETLYLTTLERAQLSSYDHRKIPNTQVAFSYESGLISGVQIRGVAS